jgi:phage-related baseplate assembly protein
VISVLSLLAPLTSVQVRASMVSALVTLGIPADQWKQGGSLSTMLTVTATTLAGFTTLFSQAVGAGFLETAAGNWLTLLAYYVYGVSRPSATFASGNLTLTNTGGGVYTYAAGQAIFADSSTGAQYTNAVSFSLGANTSTTFAVTAKIAGSAQSAAPGALDTVVTTMLFVTCSNLAAVVGQDAMLDAPLRALCQAALGAMSVRGPRTAYEYAIAVALNPVTGAPVNVNRSIVTSASHTGVVNVVVASPAGAVTSDDLTGVENSIEAIARPDAVTVNVSSATTVPYDVAIVVWVTATPGLSAPPVIAAVAQALVAYFANVAPIGGFVHDSANGIWATGLEGVVSASYPGIYAVDGLEDLILSAGQVAVDEITVSVRLN